ncbi:MAG: hypothetical protein CMK07_04525 [Ponticaulis sp.]|nr:hypothetical protein [Ponticaulis sp.]
MSHLQAKTVIAGVIMSLMTFPAGAASNLDVAQAGLCSAAMKIKRDEMPPGVRDALEYSKAADWFYRVGTEDNSEAFWEIEGDHKKALLDAKNNGSAKFTKAVDGCLTYYKTSSGE